MPALRSDSLYAHVLSGWDGHLGDRRGAVLLRLLPWLLPDSLLLQPGQGLQARVPQLQSHHRHSQALLILHACMDARIDRYMHKPKRSRVDRKGKLLCSVRVAHFPVDFWMSKLLAFSSMNPYSRVHSFTHVQHCGIHFNTYCKRGVPGKSNRVGSCSGTGIEVAINRRPIEIVSCWWSQRMRMDRHGGEAGMSFMNSQTNRQIAGLAVSLTHIEQMVV
mmetsp:Transcript_49023/g.96683  ORF Transcript_49023/g.96683 Transcript_49023/m.96683 type:complete len:219 (-) Transcript_49023:17-673(-)